MKEKRKFKRIKTKNLFGFAKTEKGRYKCEILDLSEGGVRIEVDYDYNTPNPINFSHLRVMVEMRNEIESAWGFGLITDITGRIE